MWKAWTSFLVGIWLIISASTSLLQGPVNMVIMGILMAIVGFFLLRGWEGFVNGVIGIWLLISGFISGLITMQNFLVIGIIISIISIIKIFHLHQGGEVIHKTP
jgi:hypothetical protein